MKQRTVRKKLPFIKKDKQSKSVTYWSLPSEGTYLEGVLLGAKMANIYLEEINCLPQHSPVLPMCVLSATESEQISRARHGQIVGFFTEIELALKSR